MSALIRLILMSCLAGAVSASAPETLEEVLACHAEAIGGERALGAVDNLRIVLDIREPTFEVRGTYVATRDGQMRIDIFAGQQRVFAEGLNEEGAWQWIPDAGVTASNAAGAATLKRGIESPGRFWTLGQLQARGLDIELLEAGPLANAGEWQLRLTRDDGSTFDYFLDRETCLPTREVSRRAFHPDADATVVPLETAYSEPERFDGVMRFRRGESRNLGTDEWLGTTVVRSFEHNVVLPEGYFEAR